MSTKTSFEDGRLTVTRVYAAPRAAVFEAWVETSKVQQWWGCADTAEVSSQVEPRVGGKYVHLMTLKNGFENPVHGVFVEYDPPRLLAYEMPSPVQGEVMTVRVEFIEKRAGTEVRLTHDNIPDMISEFVPGGWTAAFEKLDKVVTRSVNVN